MCECVCAQEHTCTCIADAHEYMDVNASELTQRPTQNAGFFFCFSLLYCLEIRTFTEPEAHHFSSTSSGNLGISILHIWPWLLFHRKAGHLNPGLHGYRIN